MEIFYRNVWLQLEYGLMDIIFKIEDFLWKI